MKKKKYFILMKHIVLKITKRQRFVYWWDNSRIIGISLLLFKILCGWPRFHQTPWFQHMESLILARSTGIGCGTNSLHMIFLQLLSMFIIKLARNRHAFMFREDIYSLRLYPFFWDVPLCSTHFLNCNTVTALSSFNLSPLDSQNNTT